MYYLYVKTHQITGLKYLGYTKQEDYHLYTGSGKYWVNHLNKHGYNYDTEILLKTGSMQEIKETGLFFSNLWKVDSSREWANIVKESGTGGSTYYPGSHKSHPHTDKEWHQKIGWFNDPVKRKSQSDRMKGENNPIHNLKENPFNMNRVVCKHCGIETNKGNYSRWHGDNCKSKN